MLDRETREKLFACVQKDDAAAFGGLMTSEVLSAVFGRFPLLSLLYLFDAKRIVKKHFAELVKERPRAKEEPFHKADELFLSRAGKCLRYYPSGEVSPLEMLAVLGRGKELERLYAVYPNASRFVPMLHKIYFTRLGEGVTVIGDKLILPREPLPFKEKKSLLRLSVSFLIAFVLVVAVTSAMFVYYGAGSDGNRYKARDAASALSALKFDQSVSLEKDIALAGGAEEYTSTFDGKGHIVRLKAPFAEKVTGEIRDVIFVLEEGFSGDAVILGNQGKLKNVRVVAEGVTLQKGGEYMGLLTAVNSGEIENCSAVMNVTIAGEGGGDCYFAAIAGNNSGTINNCLTDGAITATNVDVSGVVGKNEEAGTVTDCVVKATFQETSDIKSWTPNVAGVAAQNDGAVYGCTVSGSIASVLISPALAEDENAAAAYAGGIVCVNGGSVTSCENQSEVLASSQNGAAYAGGIATVNARTLTNGSVRPGTIEKNKNKGKVRATSTTHSACAGGIAVTNPQGSVIRECVVSAIVESDLALAAVEEGQEATAESLAGGIVAFNYDLVADCKNTAAVTARSNKGICFAGGIAADNYQGTVSHCGSTSAIQAASSGGSYSITGGIVAYQYVGTVERSFFTGSVSDYDEKSFSGGICGLIYIPTYVMRNNAFSAGGHANGAFILQFMYYDLTPGTIYGLAQLETNPYYSRYISEILDLGAVSATEESIKTMEDIYYE